MQLQDLINYLEKEDPKKVAPLGFSYPHSYRGIYSELAFEPTPNVTVGEMLECAKSALDTTYQGWKGGATAWRRGPNATWRTSASPARASARHCWIT